MSGLIAPDVKFSHRCLGLKFEFFVHWQTTRVVCVLVLTVFAEKKKCHSVEVDNFEAGAGRRAFVAREEHAADSHHLLGH